MHTLNIKRIYEPAAAGDGLRILVDRLWPRGLKKEEAAVDQWNKQIAPSVALRQWFNHEPEKFDAFKHRYFEELKNNTAVEGVLEHIKDHKITTLLYAAKDQEHNHAAVLQSFLKEKLR